jgi:hypothetical protein
MKSKTPSPRQTETTFPKPTEKKGKREKKREKEHM